MDQINIQQVYLALSARFAVLASVGLGLGLVGCAGGADSTSTHNPSAEQLTVRVHEVYPFDATSFTQGLELDDDLTLLVGTGMEGESRIYHTTLDGVELDSAELNPEYFGEGITRYDDHIWQLTWQDGVAIKRDADTLEEIDRTLITGQGWGLCSRQDEIVFSDGTSQLRRMDPETLAERERFEVTLDGHPVAGLNELECVGGEVYANIFTETTIVRIDATTGEVTGVIDASGLDNNATPDPNHVLNGIAHIPGTDRFLLAGKRWPDLYEVSFVPGGAAD
ncbi:glutaminyl-peptide cyclotransferase [Corynebacterium cystitidis]|uniref:glutaminyl-peptide cyclotransferase n=1 Tax=Corynebacterium cystitidis TaxID=35757 RepID=UPI00211DB4B4|nr:glutaminyl-peptide cyclotransferase [Corynebacterium cystitidis]